MAGRGRRDMPSRGLLREPPATSSTGATIMQVIDSNRGGPAIPDLRISGGGARLTSSRDCSAAIKRSAWTCAQPVPVTLTGRECRRTD